MDMNFESNAKFGDIFKTLREVDMEIEEMDLGVRSYNTLKRAGIHNMQQLLEVSLDDLMRLGKRNYGDIIDKMQFYTQSQNL